MVELEQDATGVRLRLDDGSRLEAAVAIAADGASSTLRELAGLPVARHPYAQRGVVAFVDTEHAHQATAWQRFLTTGPLAFLPFTDGRSSIVWTLPDADAERVLDLDDAAFSRELTQAFAGRLGAVKVSSPRAAFPLQRQLVQQYVSGRVLTLGDAAHVVHPLAGQGVNLGLRDVAALRTLAHDAWRVAPISRAAPAATLGAHASQRKYRRCVWVRRHQPRVLQRRDASNPAARLGAGGGRQAATAGGPAVEARVRQRVGALR